MSELPQCPVCGTPLNARMPDRLRRRYVAIPCGCDITGMLGDYFVLAEWENSPSATLQSPAERDAEFRRLSELTRQRIALEAQREPGPHGIHINPDIAERSS